LQVSGTENHPHEAPVSAGALIVADFGLPWDLDRAKRSPNERPAFPKLSPVEDALKPRVT
jgi:hypothetical protein